MKRILSILLLGLLVGCGDDHITEPVGTFTQVEYEAEVELLEGEEIVEVEEVVVEADDAPRAVAEDRVAAPYEEMEIPEEAEEEAVIPLCSEIEAYLPGGSANPFGRYPTPECKLFKVVVRG